MVYESDFYTTRRPYSRPSTYSITRQTQVDWEKVPFVPRPSLVADPITAFGKRETNTPRQQLYILTPQGRASIRPSQVVLSQPLKPYVSARDLTREKVLSAVRKHDLILEAGGEVSALTDRQHMDVLLPHTTPRHYVVVDAPDRTRRADEQYSYSYNSNTTSRDGYGAPKTTSYSNTVERRGGSGPSASNYNYSTERSSTTGDGPGGYRSSYSSTASGRLPGGTSYRHYSYRV